MPVEEVVMWKAQYRETQHIEVLRITYGSTYTVHKVDKKRAEILHSIKLDLTVSYDVGHALQTCHVITSNNCVQLLTNKLQNIFCLKLMRQTKHSF